MCVDARVPGACPPAQVKRDGCLQMQVAVLQMQTTNCKCKVANANTYLQMQTGSWYNLHMQPISKTRSIRATDEQWDMLEGLAQRRGFKSRNALILSLVDSGEERQEPKQSRRLPAPVPPLAPLPELVEGEPDYDEVDPELSEWDDWEVVPEEEWGDYEIERVPVED